ncbi:hypothetical protein PX699_20330 [Sphingobium sp. H39-3-25]|uniref:hypothetical protein n=1 Tax=Sphingomonadales TaxID=204457 RepID=UPI000618415D|nr:hypothetical protein [Sphingomonas sp. SRS2]KKC25022.1 hypothetical protein WP12_16175 [Sphingomonas sp. SRS2]MDF0544700.1 hypothetical protein [Sphingobium arseniciresistens]
MASSPEESPDAGLLGYGRHIGRRIAKAVRRTLRAIARNRIALLAVIKVAQAIVKLIATIVELFRHS